MKSLVLFCFCNTFFFFFSQNKIDFYDLININNIYKTISVLANDSLEGRNTGEKGQKKAAAFIVEELKKENIKTYKNFDYLLETKFINKTKSCYLSIDNINYNFGDDFAFNSVYQNFKESFSKLKITNLNELKNLSESGNYCVIVDSFEKFNISEIPKTFNGILFVFIKKYDKSYFKRPVKKGLLVEERADKPICFYFNYEKLSKNIKKQIQKQNVIDTDIKFELNPLQQKIKSENIHCFIEGNDSILKKEVIIISAHYDHIGFHENEIYNGADDNASGTGTILEIARVFNKLKKENFSFNRSLLFLWFTGEEHGLLGSKYYVLNPIIPLNQCITNLNIDMIGRADSLEMKNNFVLYPIGSDKLSKNLHEINELAKMNRNIVFDYKYNSDNDPNRLYFRSDHYNFAKNNIPSIFYFGGFHEDYHKPTDDIEKINFQKIHEVASLISNTIFLLLNASEKPKLD